MVTFLTSIQTDVFNSLSGREFTLVNLPYCLIRSIDGCLLEIIGYKFEGSGIEIVISIPDPSIT